MAEKYTEAQKRASLKYQQNKAQIKITVSKEQREKFKAKAQAAGMNLSQYIVKLLEES